MDAQRRQALKCFLTGMLLLQVHPELIPNHARFSAEEVNHLWRSAISFPQVEHLAVAGNHPYRGRRSTPASLPYAECTHPRAVCCALLHYGRFSGLSAWVCLILSYCRVGGDTAGTLRCIGSRSRSRLALRLLGTDLGHLRIGLRRV